MVFIGMSEFYNQKRDIICQIDNNFYIICESQYKECSSPSKSQYGVLLNEQTLNFFVKFTTQLDQILSHWMQSIHTKGLQCLFVIECNKICNLSQSQLDKIHNICLKSVQNYKNLTKNNKIFVNNQRNTKNINHPLFFKDINNLILTHWASNMNVFIDNFYQILQEQDQTLRSKLQSIQFAIRPKPQMFQEVQKVKVKMLIQFEYEQKIIYNPNLIQAIEEKRIQQMQQKVVQKADQILKQNKRPSIEPQSQQTQPQKYQKHQLVVQPQQNLNIRQEVVNIPFFLNQIQQVQSSTELEYSEEKQQKEKETPTKSRRSKALNQKVQSLTAQNSKLLSENATLKQQNQVLYEDNKYLMLKLQKVIDEKPQCPLSPLLKHSSSKRLDAQLLQEVIELQVQLGDKTKDIDLLVRFINECISKGKIDKSFVNSYCRGLKTINID